MLAQAILANPSIASTMVLSAAAHLKVAAKTPGQLSLKFGVGKLQVPGSHSEVTTPATPSACSVTSEKPSVAEVSLEDLMDAPESPSRQDLWYNKRSIAVINVDDKPEVAKKRVRTKAADVASPMPGDRKGCQGKT